MILNCGQTWSRQINFGSFSFSNMKELKKTQQWYPIYKIQNIFGFKPDLSSKYYFLQILLPLYFVIIIFRFKYQSQKVCKKLPLKLQLKAEKKSLNYRFLRFLIHACLIFLSVNYQLRWQFTARAGDIIKIRK